MTGDTSPSRCPFSCSASMPSDAIPSLARCQGGAHGNLVYAVADDQTVITIAKILKHAGAARDGVRRLVPMHLSASRSLATGRLDCAEQEARRAAPAASG